MDKSLENLVSFLSESVESIILNKMSHEKSHSDKSDRLFIVKIDRQIIIVSGWCDSTIKKSIIFIQFKLLMTHFI